MSLPPRLRGHSVALFAMESTPEPGLGMPHNTLKRNRSQTIDAMPEELPDLPKLTGHIILEVFTHRSLRLACNAQFRDNERLAVLGHNILEMMTTQLLFFRKPKLTVHQIEVQRAQLLTNETIDIWSKLYRMREELRYDPRCLQSLQTPEEGRLIFNAYLGAVFLEHGLQTVHEWIGGLLRLSTTILNDNHDMDVDIASITSKPSSPAPTSKRIKVEEPSAPPPPLPSFPPPPVYQLPSRFSPQQPPPQTRFSVQPLPPPIIHPRTNFSQLPQPTHYNPYSSLRPPLARPPSPPRISPPNPLAPAQPHLAFLPLFNQTAHQRGVSVSYPASLVGPPHAGKWNVTCVVDGIEKGKGCSDTKQQAKEQAARQAYYEMGWAPRG
ncbi:uncharacterized protein F5891DRAFT_992366 [Suillus fuscotomentosus]|uniref:Uncharacterized protein n=1 Tax=Suillus fuscotomentosus TaxID=1912939 RepID=A0AAD4EL90_9AGAM|nr:uncharacterized protein F5891DRAFT_992366 [Suillus fuscotomentosus]KAG1908275.1 hypothetical protein F5891DRAFT_992366 [Suillus fuscotomentosus]